MTNDGLLDLFVCSFVEFGLDKTRPSAATNDLGRRYYCIPSVFQPTASLLFHNNGDGTFTEVGEGTDIAAALGKSLGVVATDINNDGRMDLFVANDTVRNFLFVNRGKNEWEEFGLGAEVAFSADGQGAFRYGALMPPISTVTAGKICSWPTSIRKLHALYQNNGDESFSRRGL